MNLDVITSFNQPYYDKIGKDCVTSWLSHWPNDLSLTCYVEEISLPEDKQLIQIDFAQLGADYVNFNSNSLSKPRQKTFAKKAFCIIHAMYHSTADWILWIDADVITVENVDYKLLESILKPKYLCVYMGVRYYSRKNGTTGNWLVPESGVFAINTKHSQFKEFRQEYSRRYIEHDFEDLRKGYDNDVLGATITTIDSDYLDLCSNFTKSYKSPLSHTVLGPYLTHYKAKHSKDRYVQERQ